jgi:hypothetical protein
MSTQYRLVQSGKTASSGCSAGQGSSEPVAPRIFIILLLSVFKVLRHWVFESKIFFAENHTFIFLVLPMLSMFFSFLFFSTIQNSQEFYMISHENLKFEHILSFLWPNVVVEWVTFVLYIREVPCSNIVPETDYPGCEFFCSLSNSR